MEVFVKNGYSEARMDDIVNKSGMSKGAIYYHYKSKKDLFLALIEHWETNAFPHFYDKNEIGISSSEILKSFSEVVADVFESRKYVFLAEVEFWAMANRDEDVKDRTQKLYKKILVLFEKVLKRGIINGEFKNINPKIASIDVPKKARKKLIIATKDIKAINIAAIFAASFKPSVAPVLNASIPFVCDCLISILRSPIVSDTSVSGYIILAITSAAGADITEAANKWPAIPGIFDNQDT